MPREGEGPRQLIYEEGGNPTQWSQIDEYFTIPPIKVGDRSIPVYTKFLKPGPSSSLFFSLGSAPREAYYRDAVEEIQRQLGELRQNFPKTVDSVNELWLTDVPNQISGKYAFQASGGKGTHKPALVIGLPDERWDTLYPGISNAQFLNLQNKTAQAVGERFLTRYTEEKMGMGPRQANQPRKGIPTVIDYYPAAENSDIVGAMGFQPGEIGNMAPISRRARYSGFLKRFGNIFGQESGFDWSRFPGYVSERPGRVAFMRDFPQGEVNPQFMERGAPASFWQQRTRRGRPNMTGMKFTPEESFGPGYKMFMPEMVKGVNPQRNSLMLGEPLATRNPSHAQVVDITERMANPAKGGILPLMGAGTVIAPFLPVPDPVKGAIVGADLGSAFGLPGAAIGAGLGGLGGLVTQWLGGGEHTAEIPTALAKFVR